MRILLVADIHSNWPALAAIRETFDACLFLGDLVEYCTDPAPCIDWVRRNASLVVRGNHDHAVAQRVPAKGGSALREWALQSRNWHFQTLPQSDFTFLAKMPLMHRVELDGIRFLMVHATPRDPLDEHLFTDAEQWRSQLGDLEVDFVCVGHTHQQFVLDLGGPRVINPGSVGQPRDGDPRCAYAVIDNGEIQLKRAKYDIDATVRQLRSTTLTPDTVDFAEQVLRTGSAPKKLAELSTSDTRA